MEVNEHILDDPRYDLMFSAESEPACSQRNAPSVMLARRWDWNQRLANSTKQGYSSILTKAASAISASDKDSGADGADPL